MKYKQAKEMWQFFETCGVGLLNLAVKTKHGFKGHSRARSKEEFERALDWAWYENRCGAEVYVRPARFLPDGSAAKWPVVFLDDLKQNVALSIAREYRALVVRTSTNNCQVWIVSDKELSEDQRASLQERLARMYGGDRASTSGEHYGRLAGFWNHKRGCNVEIVYISPSSVRKLETDSLLAGPVSSGGPPVTKKLKLQDSTSHNESKSESEREFGFVIGRLRFLSSLGVSREVLEAEARSLETQLVERARRRGKRCAGDYARRTVLRAIEILQQEAAK
ncbi:MAG: hypothetical protein C4291_14395 [Candidatus Dadabacteria bacterium]